MMKDEDSPSSAAELAGDSQPLNSVRNASTSPRTLVWFVLIAAITVGVDQATKFWAEAQLASGERTALLGDLLGLRLVYNSGAAFSFGAGSTWVLTILATVVAVVIIRIAPKITSAPWMWALSLLLGGAIGNLVDRFFKAPGFPQGHVVDFIDYGIFIGNVADIAIVLAAALMVFLGFSGRELAAPQRSGAPHDE